MEVVDHLIVYSTPDAGPPSCALLKAYELDKVVRYSRCPGVGYRGIVEDRRRTTKGHRPVDSLYGSL